LFPSLFLSINSFHPSFLLICLSFSPIHFYRFSFLLPFLNSIFFHHYFIPTFSFRLSPFLFFQCFSLFLVYCLSLIFAPFLPLLSLSQSFLPYFCPYCLSNFCPTSALTVSLIFAPFLPLLSLSFLPHFCLIPLCWR
jgi:hypothetical protein